MYLQQCSHESSGTNLYGGIETAFELLNSAEESRPLVSMVVHLTDGQPTAGSVIDPREIVNAITAMNVKRGRRSLAVFPLRTVDNYSIP